MTAIYHWLWYLLPANPVLARIVQGGSVRLRDLWVRMAYLGILIMIVIVGLLTSGGLGEASLSDLAKTGSLLFKWVAYGQVLGVCLLAPLFMAGAISQEQSGQTFDILLTTPLSNLQIVIGSLLGRLFFVLALLVSGLPLFSVMLVFGGVPPWSIFIAFVVAGLVALVVGSVAIFLSVLRKGGRRAVYIFIISIAAYLIALYGVDQFLRAVQVRNWRMAAQAAQTGGQAAPMGQTTILTPLHPLLVLESFVNTAGYKPPMPEDLADRSLFMRWYLSRPLGAFATLSVLISTILILWSAIKLRHLGEGEPNRLVAALRKTVGLSPFGGERRRKPRAVWANAIAWREAHTRINRVSAYLGRTLFVLLALGLAGTALVLYHVDQLPPIPDPMGGGVQTYSNAQTFQLILQLLLWIELGIVVMVAIYMSAGSVSREREDGTLDLLLTTPITPRQYIWGKLRGLVSFLTLLLAAPILTILMVGVYTLVGSILGWPQASPVFNSQNHLLILPEAALLAPLILVPFIAMCVAVGMSFSLKARGVLGAVVPAVGILGIWIVIVGFCGMAAAKTIPFIGLLNTFSPVTSLMMLINPWEAWGTGVAGFDDAVLAGRIGMLFAAIVAALGYCLIVWLMIQSMVRSFDHTVRRLSGESN